MAQYDSYKDSGVQWLGQIPSHWVKHKLSHFLIPFSDKGHADKPLLSVTRERGILLRGAKGDDDNNNVIPEDLSGYKHVMPGDFVINKMKAWQGSYGVSDFEGIVSPAYFTYHLKFPNNRFFARVLRSKAYTPFFMQYSKGIRVDQWDLTPESLKAIPIFIPSTTEQEAIVAYLDRETYKIDEAISQQQKMIDLLNERKQIIINQVVTRGLDPNVNLRPSGIDCLGDMPAHWGIKRFKYLFNTGTGITFTKADLIDEGISTISYGQIHAKYNSGVRVNPLMIRYIPSNLTKGKDKTLSHVGDFLFADTSEDFDGCGNCVYINENQNIYAGYHTILAKCKHEQIGQYLGYLFNSQSWRTQLRRNVNGVKVYSITQSIINSTFALLPPQSEQEAIVAYLDEETGKIDRAIDKASHLITLLQERKQIIINDVVTGKVKVI